MPSPSLLQKRQRPEKDKVCPLKGAKPFPLLHYLDSSSPGKQAVWAMLCKLRNASLRLSGTFFRPHGVTLNPPPSHTSALCIRASSIIHVAAL